MTRGIRLLGLSALVLIAALVLFMSAQDTKATPPPFNPGGQICFDNYDTAAECDGNTTAGASPDISSKFCVGWGDVCAVQPNIATIDESNFGAVATMLPTSFVPSSATNAPVGAIAGVLSANSVLGILNGPCSTTVAVSFSLMVASVDQGNPISPKAVGLSNPAEPLAVDVNPQNGIPDGADRYPAYLSTFFQDLQPRARLFGTSKIYGAWVTLNFLFFEPGAHVVTTANTDIKFDANLGFPSITVLGDPSVPPSPGAISDFCAPLRSQNTTFGETFNNPCTPELPETDRLKGNCPLQKLAGANNSTQNVNYPYLPCDSGNGIDEDGDGKINDGCPQVNTVSEQGADCDNATSDDPTPAAPEDTAINDGCPAVGDPEFIRVGNCAAPNEGKCVIRQNPGNGTSNFIIVASSQRDADSDGIENGLDVCALDFNADWNPHIVDTVNDSDADGLPNVCDPDPNVKSGQSPITCEAGIVGDDQDKDCFANRADNCPKDNQLANPSAPPDASNLPSIDDDDYDGIGNPCDPNPDQVNGEFQGYCIQFGLDVGSPAQPETGTRTGSAPECAGEAVVQSPVTQTPPPGSTNQGGTSSGGSSGGSNSGGGVGTVDTGVGSLSPTNAGIPLWAALLAAVGGLGLLIGAGMLRYNAAKRRIE
jgi:hypothetical protein